MILGATHGDILAFLAVLALSIPLGILYDVETFFRMITKSKVLRFIYDFLYVIIAYGIFVCTMYTINGCDIKYYHILALIIGILLTGILPSSRINRHKEAIESWHLGVTRRIKESRLYRIIMK